MFHDQTPDNNMPALSQAKAFQLVGTGALMVVFGSGVFALLYVIHGEKYDDGEKSGLFDRNSAFWTSTPVSRKSKQLNYTDSKTSNPYFKSIL